MPFLHLFYTGLHNNPFKWDASCKSEDELLKVHFKIELVMLATMVMIRLTGHPFEKARPVVKRERKPLY